MQTISRFLCCLSVCIGLFGCAIPTNQQSADAEKIEFVRGSVSIDEKGKYYITPCFSSERRWLVDDAKVLEKRYKEQSPYQALPVYMELSAYQNVTLGWEVKKIHLAGGSGQACSNDMTGVNLRAAGTEPLWIADITDEGVRIQSYKKMRTLLFPLDKDSGQNGVWTGEMDGVNGLDHDYRLTLTNQSCRDQLNAWYSKSAKLEFDGDTFFGCAREGNLTEKAIQGRYSSLLDDQSVFVVLDIQAVGKTKMLLDYRSGQPLIVFSGTWRWNKNGKLVLEFSELDGRQQNLILIMVRSADGGLQQEGFSAEFGQAGLKLQRSE